MNQPTRSASGRDGLWSSGFGVVDISLRGRASAGLPVRLVGERTNAPCVNPAVIEVDRVSAFSQNGQLLRYDVNAAISSRIPGLSGAVTRIICCVNRARCSVAAGRNANMCQICGYSAPPAGMISIASRYGPEVDSPRPDGGKSAASSGCASTFLTAIRKN